MLPRSSQRVARFKSDCGSCEAAYLENTTNQIAHKVTSVATTAQHPNVKLPGGAIPRYLVRAMRIGFWDDLSPNHSNGRPESSPKMPAARAITPARRRFASKNDAVPTRKPT